MANSVIPEDAQHRADLEQGERDSILLSDLRGETRSSYRSSAATTTSNYSLEDSKERQEFDDGANALWSLYGKEAKAHDEDRFVSLADDMGGVLVFAGLFSGVLTTFLVQNLQSLQVNPTDKSAYYQNQSAYYQWQSAYFQQQSVAMLANISQQLASITLQASASSTVSTPSTVSQFSASSFAQQVSVPPTTPLPYAFQPSVSDIRVNAFWLVGLVCSLSAALLAILIQQWVRSYMQVFQRYDRPLKRARFRQFFFEGSAGMRKLAKQVPRLIKFSLFLFFLGLCDSMLTTNKNVGIITIVPIGLCGIFYLYIVTAHLNKLQSHKILISHLIQKYRRFFGDIKWRTLKNFEQYPSQEELVMKGEERKERDVRAIRWLVDNTAVNAEMEPLVLAIPGTFNTEWGRAVWTVVASPRLSDSDTLEPQTDYSSSSTNVSTSLMNSSSRLSEGTARDTICLCVRYLFETCKNHSCFENEDARRRRMRACVEAAASLVCCIDFQLDWFGEIGKVVSEIGHIEKINQLPTTTSDPSFIIRWTCLALVSVQQILRSNGHVLAELAVGGLARAQPEYGQPDEHGTRSAQRIEGCLKTAWERVEELRRAFEPWTQQRSRKQVKEILRKHEQQISELARIKSEADWVEDVDWRISLYQDAMDEDTFRLTRQLPGVSFDEPRRTESFRLSDTFITQSTGTASVIPQLIFPGQQVQALTRLGLKLGEILDGQEVVGGHKEVLESLKSVDQVPESLRRPNGLVVRQLWRLQDLRDGRGLGFTVELFFLSLRRLLSIPSLHESNSVFYIGAFKVIASRWEDGKDALGTQRILLNIICDLIIPGRGVFSVSNFSYPERVTTILVDMVGNMLREYEGPDEHIRDAVREIEDVDESARPDIGLRGKAQRALSQFHGTSFVL